MPGAAPPALEPVSISVIIPTYNRWSSLRETIRSLVKQDYSPADYELVVVIDGSTDATAEQLRSLEVPCSITVLTQEKRGPAVARNAGIAAASGDIALFMDDDIRCNDQVLREHAAGHRVEPGVRVHGSIFLDPASPPTLAAWSIYEWYLQYDAAVTNGDYRNPNASPHLIANSSLSLEVLRNIGGFDETVSFPREDFELSLRIASEGIVSRYRSRAVAYELFGKPSRDFVADAVGHGRAEVVISRKHPAYRPHSALAPLDRAELVPWRALARRTMMRLPRGTERLFDPPIQAAESLIRRPRARRAGVRLVSLQHRVRLVHGAHDAAGSASALEAEFERRLPVLLYHRVGVGSANLDPLLSVAPRVFERQISWLARRGFRSIRSDEWLAWREGRAALPHRAVLITFDDAYSELSEFALPTLLRYDFAALVFVVTSLLGQTNTWDEIAPQADRPTLMTADEVTHWARRGFEFGAHGRTHADLSLLTDSDLEREIVGSRHDLEGILGEPVACFAYPYGRSGPDARRLVASTYELAFGVEEGLNGLRTSPHMLRRMMVTAKERPMDLEWRVRTGRIPMARTQDAVRLRSRLRALRRAALVHDRRG